MQNKRNQNGNRYKTKKQLFNAIQKQKTENNIINLSNNKILNKGLNFVPKPRPTNYETIYSAYQQYQRSMYLQYHHRHQTDNHTKHPFKAKSTFTPHFQVTPTFWNTFLASYMNLEPHTN